ncbi:MAG: DUF2341 domain-containing protein, partial [Nitrospirae bacterium]|nr:DUF2341 domain-containing protein [Nitrospirota bacterium]
MRRKYLLLPNFYAVIFFLFFSFVSEVFAADWYNSSWSFRKKITVQSGQVSSGPHTDFPMLVNLASDAQLAANAQADGDDILFTKSDGTTKLDHEIESYTAGTGALVAWVEVNSIDNGTVIYMYYGNSGAGNQENVTDTWNGNYVNVWHKKDLTTSSIKDSTINGNNGDKAAANEPIEADGKIGKAQSYSGSNYISLSSANLPVGNSSFTSSAWINLPNVNYGFSPIVCWGAQANNQANWTALVSSGKLTHVFYSNDLTGDTALSNNTWYYVAVTYDGTTRKLYLNGSEDKSADPSSTPAVNGTTLVMGMDSAFDWALTGKSDEVRVSDIARSAGWIATEYNNQYAPGSFYSLGSNENTFTWTGASSTDWNTAANWDVNAVPGAGHTAVIPDVSGGSNRFPVLGGATTVTN